jgi:hypothetical protein
MNDPNPFLPVIYSSTTSLLVALALAVTWYRAAAD